MLLLLSLFLLLCFIVYVEGDVGEDAGPGAGQGTAVLPLGLGGLCNHRGGGRHSADFIIIISIIIDIVIVIIDIIIIMINYYYYYYYY